MDSNHISIGSAKRALKVDTWADFARELGLPRQSMTGRKDCDAMPDAWIGRAARLGKDIFGPTPEGQGGDAASS